MNFFSKFENHSLESLRENLEAANRKLPSFIPLLEKHHRFLMESIQVILNPAATPSDKQTHLTRFIHVLKMHNLAEEETLYRRLSRGEMKDRIEAIRGRNEHHFTAQLIEEMHRLGFDRTGYPKTWTQAIDAKANIIAGLMKSHIQEEENQLFPLAKRAIREDELRSLAETYIEKCRNFLDQELRIRPFQTKGRTNDTLGGGYSANYHPR